VVVGLYIRAQEVDGTPSDEWHEGLEKSEEESHGDEWACKELSENESGTDADTETIHGESQGDENLVDESHVWLLGCSSGSGPFSPIEVEDEIVCTSPAGSVGRGAIARNIVGFGILGLSDLEFLLVACAPSHMDVTPYFNLYTENDFHPAAVGIGIVVAERSRSSPYGISDAGTTHVKLEGTERVACSDKQAVILKLVSQ